MQNLLVEQLSAASEKTLAHCFVKVLSRQQDHEYISWLLLSYAHKVQLVKDDRILDRDEYPEVFDEYLPEIPDRDKTYKIATLPGKTNGLNDAVKICLGPAWDSRIAADIEDRAFIGTADAISDNTRTVSRIPGWDLTKVSIVKKSSEGIKVACLYFEKHQEQGSGDSAPEKLTASWEWRG